MDVSADATSSAAAAAAGQVIDLTMSDSASDAGSSGSLSESVAQSSSEEFDPESWLGSGDAHEDGNDSDCSSSGRPDPTPAIRPHDSDSDSPAQPPLRRPRRSVARVNYDERSYYGGLGLDEDGVKKLGELFCDYPNCNFAVACDGVSGVTTRVHALL